MDWPQPTDKDLARFADIVAYRAALDQLPHGEEQRLRIASMGAEAGTLISQYIWHLKITRILEIGLCAGIGAAYMCSAAERHGRVEYIGLEHDSDKCAIADQTLKKFCRNTEYTFLCGEFDDTLATALDRAQPLQFVYLDGHHKREPTVRMFNQCVDAMTQGGVIVCDDLGWKAQGDARWLLQRHPRVTDHWQFAKKDAFTIKP